MTGFIVLIALLALLAIALEGQHRRARRRPDLLGTNDPDRLRERRELWAHGA